MPNRRRFNQPQRHLWLESSAKDGNGKPMAEWCQKCGTDKTPETVKTVCHPTRLPGF